MHFTFNSQGLATCRSVSVIFKGLTSGVWALTVSSIKRRAGTVRINSTSSLLSVVLQPSTAPSRNDLSRGSSTRAHGFRTAPLMAMAR